MKGPSENSLLLGYNQFLCAEQLAEGGPFTLSLFEDLNRLVESVVLYDKVLLLGDYDLPSGLFATPLKKAGVLEMLPTNHIRTIISRDVARARFRSCLVDAFGENVGDTDDAQPERVLECRVPYHQPSGATRGQHLQDRPK